MSTNAHRDQESAHKTTLHFTSLKTKFILIILAVYLITGSVALAFSLFATERIIQNLGIDFATKQALWDKNRILAPLEREIALAKKMADSPLLQQWARRENEATLRDIALAEINSYRRNFQDDNAFFIIDASKHYYFDDVTDPYPEQKFRYTLDARKPRDSWYFSTLGRVDDFDLNVNYDEPMDVTNVWINVIVKDSNEKLGLAGTGLNLSDFIQAVVNEAEKGVSTILLDQVGAIKAHQNPKYIDYNTLAKKASERSTLFRLLASPQERDRLQQSLQRLAANQSEVETLYLTLNGQRFLAAVSYLQPIEWYNLALVDLSEVISTWEFAPMVAVLVLSLLAVILLVIVLLNRIILRPLASLTRSSQAIAAGNYDITLPQGRPDEIGQLTHSFQHMTETVRDYTNNLELKVKARTEELHQSHRKLEASNRQIMDSIHYARLIQSSILPSDEALRRCLRDYFIIWKPRNVVGGDFYYFQPGERGFLIGVIDCTGHGVPGAFMTMTANAVLGRAIEAIGMEQVASLLETVNRLMRTTLNQDQTIQEVDNGLDMGLCYCDPEREVLTFAGARIALYYTAGDTLLELKGDRHSLGYQRSNPDFRFTQHTLDQISKRRFYLTTDGFLDQAGGPKGFGFGKRRFLDMLSRHQTLPLEAQKIMFEESLSAYQGNHPQRDDITLISFQIKSKS